MIASEWIISRAHKMATTKTRAQRLVWSLGARKELLDSVDKTRSLDLNSGRDNLISIHVNKRIFLEKLLARRIWELYWPISRLWLAGWQTNLSESSSRGHSGSFDLVISLYGDSNSIGRPHDLVSLKVELIYSSIDWKLILFLRLRKLQVSCLDWPQLGSIWAEAVERVRGRSWKIVLGSHLPWQTDVFARRPLEIRSVLGSSLNFSLSFLLLCVCSYRFYLIRRTGNETKTKFESESESELELID